MIRTCTEFHAWIAKHQIDPSHVTLVVRADGLLLSELIRAYVVEELNKIDITAGYFADPKIRIAKMAGIHLVITSLDESARVK